MQLHRDASEGINLVTGYDRGQVRVGERVLAPPCIVGIEAIIEDWQPGTPEALRADALQPAVELRPELILLGTGAALEIPPVAVTAEINRLGVGLETMDSAAACRTYNVLAHEGRRVVLALLRGQTSVED